MRNTLTDQLKNKPTRNCILKIYKDTKLTNRELADSILNSVIRRERGSCWNCASCICTGFMYLVLLLSGCSLFKGSGLFLTSGRGRHARFFGSLETEQRIQLSGEQLESRE